MAEQQSEAIEHAAAYIAGEAPAPAWLIEIVALGVIGIRGNHATREESPTRSEIRARLVAIRSAAAVLAREFEQCHRDIRRYTAIAWLQAAGLDQATINALTVALPKLAACATAARVPAPGQGRHKSFPNQAALTPHEMCAALVAYGWQNSRGKLPPHAYALTHKACEAVWQAAGLSRARAGNSESLTGWLTHLQRIKSRIRASQSDKSVDWPMQIFWRGLQGLHVKAAKSPI
jgi:hypothetical protein